MAEKQTNYTIMEGYELPSRGKIYETDLKAHIELRSMTARDEMKRLSPSSTPLKTLADIIEGCCIEKPAIPVYDMCLGDYEFLLHKLRIVTYGGDYKISIRCPECGEIAETVAQLETLEVRGYDEEIVEPLRSFNLPSCGRNVVIKFISPRLMEEIEAKEKDLKRRRKTSQQDFGTLAKLLYCIDYVDGNKLPEHELETFIQNLPARDMQKILNNLEALNQTIGIDTKLVVTCNHCGSDVDALFRFGPEFFRPTTI